MNFISIFKHKTLLSGKNGILFFSLLFVVSTGYTYLSLGEAIPNAEEFGHAVGLLCRNMMSFFALMYILVTVYKGVHFVVNRTV